MDPGVSVATCVLSYITHNISAARTRNKTDHVLNRLYQSQLPTLDSAYCFIQIKLQRSSIVSLGSQLCSLCGGIGSLALANCVSVYDFMSGGGFGCLIGLTKHNMCGAVV